MEKVVTEQQLRSYYKGKKIFVTGHTGFKGSWLSAWLNKLGAQIKGYALAPEYENCLYSLMQPLYIGESIIADIRDREKLQKELISFQPDYIFHLAAQPLVRRSYQVPAETFEINAVGTANLLEAVNLLGNKCTVIIITTDKVYENKEQDILYNENDALGGYDPYSASKACTEIVVGSFRNSFFNINNIDKHQKAIGTVRAGNVIGGGDYSSDRIIPDIIKALQHSTTVEVRNPGAVRPWQHVLEPLAGYLLLGGLMSSDPVKYSGAYNFGPEEEGHLPVKNLVELSIKTWGGGNWTDTSAPGQPHEAGLLKLDITKAKQLLGWQQKLDAVKAIEWTIDWYKQDINNAAAFTFRQIDNYINL